MAKKKKGGKQNVWNVYGTQNELGRKDAWDIPHFNFNTIITLIILAICILGGYAMLYDEFNAPPETVYSHPVPPYRGGRLRL